MFAQVASKSPPACHLPDLIRSLLAGPATLAHVLARLVLRTLLVPLVLPTAFCRADGGGVRLPGMASENGAPDTTAAITIRWPEATGFDSFDGSRMHLLTRGESAGLTALIQEGGPSRSPARVTHPVLDVDVRGRVLATSGWSPGRLPLELLEFRPVLDDEQHVRWWSSCGILIGLPGGLSLAERIIIDSDRAHDPTARITEYRQLDASVEIPLSLLRYQSGPFECQVGRTWQRWGPAWTGSLIMDNAFPSADGVHISYASDRWSARFFCERLENAGPVPDVRGQVLSRYLSAHRVDVAVADGLRLGLTETALCAASGGPPFWAWNPLLPWSLTQQERGGGQEAVNVLWAVDAVWNPRPNWALYGQFLIDDYMLDRRDRDKYPDQLGFAAGVLWQGQQAIGSATVATRSALSAGLEYSRLSTWTYVNRNAYVRYQAWGAGIGHPYGPDSESFTAFLEWRHLRGARRLLLLGRWEQHGRIGLQTEESPVGQVGEPFPAPPVTRRWQGKLIAMVAGPRGSFLSWHLGWGDQSASSVIESGPTAGRDDGWYTAVAVSFPLWSWNGSLAGPRLSESNPRGSRSGP